MNRQIFIAFVENKGIAVNCGENGEIGNFSVVCFQSKPLKKVANTSCGSYAVIFPKTTVKTTDLQTIANWLDRSRKFENTTCETALERFAKLDIETQNRIIERCCH